MYEAQYEALRAQVIGTSVPLRGVGLAVLLQEGLASWVLALRVCISSSRLPVTAGTVLVRTERDETATITSGLQFVIMPLFMMMLGVGISVSPRHASIILAIAVGLGAGMGLVAGSERSGSHHL